MTLTYNIRNLKLLENISEVSIVTNVLNQAERARLTNARQPVVSKARFRAARLKRLVPPEHRLAFCSAALGKHLKRWAEVKRHLWPPPLMGKPAAGGENRDG